MHPQHVTIKETGFFNVTHGRNILQSANTFARKTGQDDAVSNSGPLPNI